MVVDLVVLFLGLGVLAASTQLLIRTWPDRRIGPGERLRYPWRYYALLVSGVILWVIGGQRLQNRVGGWVYPLSLVAALAVTYGRVLAHNRSVSRPPS